MGSSILGNRSFLNFSYFANCFFVLFCFIFLYVSGVWPYGRKNVVSLVKGSKVSWKGRNSNPDALGNGPIQPGL